MIAEVGLRAGRTDLGPIDACQKKTHSVTDEFKDDFIIIKISGHLLSLRRKKEISRKIGCKKTDGVVYGEDETN